MEDPSSTAQVATPRAGRYAKQLVAHMTRKTTGEWDEEAGSGHLDFGENRVALTAEPHQLILNLSAAAGDMDRLEHVVGIHLARFGARDGLVVAWRRADGSEGTTQTAPESEGRPGPR